MSGDRLARHELERKLGDALPDGRRVWDPSFTALYQLEPTWATAVICWRCHYVGIIPSIPSKPLTWRCSQDGTLIPINPPGEVLEAVRPPGTAGLIVPGGRRARLS